MRYSTVLPFLALVPSIAAFKFTKPDVDKKLNLSAESITISWTADSNDSQFDDVTVIFTAPSFNAIIINLFPLAVGTGEFAWNPKDIRQALEKNNTVLPNTKDFYFQAMLGGKTATTTRVNSEKYAVEGYSRISAGHRLHQGLGAWILAAAVGVALL